MFTTTSFAHPTMLAKIRQAIKFAVKGEGENMQGHAHRCYVTNSKGRNILRVDYRNKEVIIMAGCTAASGIRGASKDVTELVKAAFALARVASN